MWGLMSISPLWLYPLEWLLIAGRFHALGVVLHDACHMRADRGSPAARVLELLAGYPIATTLAAMRYHHLRHHRFSGMPLDPYLKLGISASPLRRNLRRALGLLLVPAWILRCFYGTVALMVPAMRSSYAHRFLQDKSGRSLTFDPQVLNCLRAEPRQALWFTLVAAAMWVYPAAVIAYYLIPLLIAGALNVNRVLVEHEHVHCADRRPETVLATTLTQDRGVLGRAFLFPHNIGFHQAHHLYPAVALECLPALDRYLRTAT
jgi:fatty acid desaturase